MKRKRLTGLDEVPSQTCQLKMSAHLVYSSSQNQIYFKYSITISVSFKVFFFITNLWLHMLTVTVNIVKLCVHFTCVFHVFIFCSNRIVSVGSFKMPDFLRGAQGISARSTSIGCPDVCCNRQNSRIALDSELLHLFRLLAFVKKG